MAEVHDEVRSLSLDAPAHALASGFVLRRAVLELLGGSTGQLVVVAAPAGYGKTAHVAAWSQRDGRPVVRIGLDRSCNNLNTFVPAVLGEISVVADVSFGPLMKRWSSAHGEATPIASAIADALRFCTTPFILVLDDVHVIDRREVTDLIRTIAANVPPVSTVVLVGQTVGHLNFGGVTGYSGAAEIGPHDLALDTDDARSLFDQLDVAAEDEQLANIVEQADGWPLGIRLAALTERLTGVRERQVESAPPWHDEAETPFEQENWLDRLSNDLHDRSWSDEVDTLPMPGVETGVRSQPLTNDRAFVLADRAAVTPLADQASQIIDRHLAACIVASHIEPAAARLGDPVVASPYRVPLTAAELKVLRYLPTNLTFDRVAERLYVSRNTVKSHVAAVYRKLGVSCRHDAVERARIVGLLDDDHHTAE